MYERDTSDWSDFADSWSIQILQDFHLQISLLEGCQTILNGDSSELSKRVQRDQTSGFFLTG